MIIAEPSSRIIAEPSSRIIAEPSSRIIAEPSSRIIASDLEGTLTTGETWRGLRAYLEAHGRTTDFWWFFASQMPGFISAKLGLIPKREFQNQWTAKVMRLFCGQTLEQFQMVAIWIAEHELLPKIRQNVLSELIQAKAGGARVILASGTYQPVLEAFAAKFGFEAIGTPLEVQNGLLTGKVLGEISVGLTKRRNLEQWLAGQVLTCAYGDTMPDIPMLELAQTAIIASGDAELEQQATNRNWRIIK